MHALDTPTILLAVLNVTSLKELIVAFHRKAAHTLHYINYACEYYVAIYSAYAHEIAHSVYT